jgi:hypothetical protein
MPALRCSAACTSAPRNPPYHRPSLPRPRSHKEARRRRHRNRWQRSWRTRDHHRPLCRPQRRHPRRAARSRLVMFNPDRPLPLALHVHHQLCAALGVPRSQVDAVLQWWCAQPVTSPCSPPVACDGASTEARRARSATSIVCMLKSRWNRPCNDTSGRARLHQPACSQGFRPSSGRRRPGGSDHRYCP